MLNQIIINAILFKKNTTFSDSDRSVEPSDGIRRWHQSGPYMFVFSRKNHLVETEQPVEPKFGRLNWLDRIGKLGGF